MAARLLKVWRNNPALWFVVAVFVIGAGGTIYTVAKIVAEKLVTDTYFGYTKEELESNYEGFFERFEKFNHLNLTVSYDSTLDIGNSSWQVYLTDSAQKPVTGADVSLFLKDPVQDTPERYINLSPTQAPGTYISDAFYLAIKKAWVLQLKIELGDALHFDEVFFIYDQDRGIFVAQPDFWQKRDRRWYDIGD